MNDLRMEEDAPTEKKICLIDRLGAVTEFTGFFFIISRADQFGLGSFFIVNVV